MRLCIHVAGNVTGDVFRKLQVSQETHAALLATKFNNKKELQNFLQLFYRAFFPTSTHDVFYMYLQHCGILGLQTVLFGCNFVSCPLRAFDFLLSVRQPPHPGYAHMGRVTFENVTA